MGDETTCSVAASGVVACWGCNDSGQRGDADVTCSDAKAVVALAEPAVQVSLGSNRGCAVLASGAVACWGSNAWGALGDGVAHHATCPRTAIAWDCSPAAVRVRGLDDAAEVAVSEDHVCARRHSGQVVCWGMNTYGQLGEARARTVRCPRPSWTSTA